MFLINIFLRMKKARNTSSEAFQGDGNNPSFTGVKLMQNPKLWVSLIFSNVISTRSFKTYAKDFIPCICTKKLPYYDTYVLTMITVITQKVDSYLIYLLCSPLKIILTRKLVCKKDAKN